MHVIKVAWFIASVVEVKDVLHKGRAMPGVIVKADHLSICVSL